MLHPPEPCRRIPQTSAQIFPLCPTSSGMNVPAGRALQCCSNSPINENIRIVLKLGNGEDVEAISNLCLTHCSWLSPNNLETLLCSVEHSRGSLWEQVGKEAGYHQSIDFLQVLERGAFTRDNNQLPGFSEHGSCPCQQSTYNCWAGHRLYRHLFLPGK